MLRAAQADAFALGRDSLPSFVAEFPGSHIVDGGFQQTGIAIAVPKGHPEALAYVTKFVGRQGLWRRSACDGSGRNGEPGCCAAGRSRLSPPRSADDRSAPMFPSRRVRREPARRRGYGHENDDGPTKLPVPGSSSEVPVIVIPDVSYLCFAVPGRYYHRRSRIAQLARNGDRCLAFCDNRDCTSSLLPSALSARQFRCGIGSIQNLLVAAPSCENGTPTFGMRAIGSFATRFATAGPFTCRSSFRVCSSNRRSATSSLSSQPSSTAARLI